MGNAWRTARVRIVGSTHTPPPATQVVALCTQLCDALRTRIVCGGDAASDVVGLAFWRLTWIHPFLDGNGRTAALFAWAVARIFQAHRFPRERSQWQRQLWTPVPDTPPIAAHSFGVAHMRRRAVWLSALRDMDALWYSKSAEQRRTSWLLQVRRANAAAPAVAPWRSVGDVLLRDVWKWFLLHRKELLPTSTVLRYRWVNYFDGDCYSTGLTDSYTDAHTVISTQPALYALNEAELLDVSQQLHQELHS